MARASFEQTMVIAASPEEIRAALGSLAAHDQLHPLIVSVRQIGERVRADGVALRRYRIVDRVPMGPLNLRVTYHAEVGVDTSGAVVSDAFQSPGVRLRVVSRVTPIAPDGSQTRVDETVVIEVPRLLLGYVRAQAYHSHRALFANLKRWLESGRESGREPEAAS